MTFDDYGHMKRDRDVIFYIDMHLNPIRMLIYDRFTSEVIRGHWMSKSVN